jgi:DNA-binding NtrC family response regulator
MRWDILKQLRSFEVQKFMSKPKKKILVIDDDARIRESVRLAVQEQDFFDIKVVESSNVIAGITQLKKLKPDVVILDLHMPDKSGFDFLDIMHQDKLFAKTKVIMLTADDTFKNLFKAEGKGIDAYYFLGKPFNISDLQAMVLKICLPLKT